LTIKKKHQKGKEGRNYILFEVLPKKPMRERRRGREREGESQEVYYLVSVMFACACVIMSGYVSPCM
jgi:hypothetical protein